jgi:hypothetical protein
MINGECLVKCPDGTNREGNLCVPQIDTTKPVSIKTDVEMGGFEQSDTKKTGQFSNIKKVIIVIDISKKEVTFRDEKGKEYILYGDKRRLEKTKKTTNGRSIIFKTNGLGSKYGEDGRLINEWDLNINTVRIVEMKIGTELELKNGISIDFHKQANPSMHTPPRVFIYTDNINSYEQDGQTRVSTPKVLQHVLLNALIPTSRGGRRKTIKRKHKYSRKLKNHHKKTRKHSKKHTRKHK